MDFPLKMGTVNAPGHATAITIIISFQVSDERIAGFNRVVLFIFYSISDFTVESVVSASLLYPQLGFFFLVFFYNLTLSYLPEIPQKLLIVLRFALVLSSFHITDYMSNL